MHTTFRTQCKHTQTHCIEAFAIFGISSRLVDSVVSFVDILAQVQESFGCVFSCLGHIGASSVYRCSPATPQAAPTGAPRRPNPDPRSLAATNLARDSHIVETPCLQVFEQYWGTQPVQAQSNTAKHSHIDRIDRIYRINRIDCIDRIE